MRISPSPIRRYADLLVHRALIAGLKLGSDGLPEDEMAGFADTAEAITATERRATLAERDSTDRYLALYLQHRVGERFASRVSGVTKFGLFVTLTESGASGFLPMAGLPDDFWVYDEPTHSLIGKRTRHSFQLAQPLEVRLLEARPVTGGLILGLERGELALSSRRGAAPAPSAPGRRLPGAAPEKFASPVRQKKKRRR